MIAARLIRISNQRRSHIWPNDTYLDFSRISLSHLNYYSTTAQTNIPIYWTLKTGYGSIQYALGNTNQIKGTGVCKNMVDVKRDDDNSTAAASDSATSTKESPTKKEEENSK